jgi:hypothetical protein
MLPIPDSRGEETTTLARVRATKEKNESILSGETKEMTVSSETVVGRGNLGGSKPSGGGIIENRQNKRYPRSGTSDWRSWCQVSKI